MLAETVAIARARPRRSRRSSAAWRRRNAPPSGKLPRVAFGRREEAVERHGVRRPARRATSISTMSSDSARRGSEIAVAVLFPRPTARRTAGSGRRRGSRWCASGSNRARSRATGPRPAGSSRATSRKRVKTRSVRRDFPGPGSHVEPAVLPVRAHLVAAGPWRWTSISVAPPAAAAGRRRPRPSRQVTTRSARRDGSAGPANGRYCGATNPLPRRRKPQHAHDERAEREVEVDAPGGHRCAQRRRALVAWVPAGASVVRRLLYGRGGLYHAPRSPSAGAVLAAPPAPPAPSAPAPFRPPPPAPPRSPPAPPPATRTARAAGAR